MSTSSRQHVEVRYIPLSALRAHPANSNRMGPQARAKLSRYIRRNRAYPPLANHSFYSNTFSPGMREHLRLAFCHLRGTARSTWLPVDDLTIDSVVEDPDAVRQELGLERVAVLGHSGHSYFALDYARLHPDETAAVILISPWPAWRGSELEDYWESCAGPCN